MQYGDLSNQIGPAIVINADLLGEIKRSKVLRRKEFKAFPHSRDLLTHWFKKGLNIYIACIGDSANFHKTIETQLAIYFIPYTTIYPILYPFQLESLVSADHVVGYYYHSNTMVNERMKLGKHHKVLNIAEISYMLDGRVLR